MNAFEHGNDWVKFWSENQKSLFQAWAEGKPPPFAAAAASRRRRRPDGRSHGDLMKRSMEEWAALAKEAWTQSGRFDAESMKKLFDPGGVEARRHALRHGAGEAHRGTHLRDALGPRPQDAQRAEALDRPHARRRAVLGGGAGRVEPRARALHEGAERRARRAPITSGRADARPVARHRQQGAGRDAPLEGVPRGAAPHDALLDRVPPRRARDRRGLLRDAPHPDAHRDGRDAARGDGAASARCARCSRRRRRRGGRAAKPRRAKRRAQAAAQEARRSTTHARESRSPGRRQGIHRVQRAACSRAASCSSKHQGQATSRSPPRPSARCGARTRPCSTTTSRSAKKTIAHAGARGLRPHRPLHDGRPAGGPLADPQPARRRASTSTSSTGARPRAATGGSRSRTTSTATSATASTSSARSRASTRSRCSASARAASSPPATPRTTRSA